MSQHLSNVSLDVWEYTKAELTSLREQNRVLKEKIKAVEELQRYGTAGFGAMARVDKGEFVRFDDVRAALADEPKT